MSLKIKEEVLHVENMVGENTIQTVFQTALDLPGTAPSIGRVVWVKGDAVVTDSNVGLDKVSLEGYIDLSLVYMYEDFEAGRLNYQIIPYPHALSFSDYVEIIGAEEGMLVWPDVLLLGIEWEAQLDQRTVNVDVLLQSSALVKQQSSYDVITNVSIRAPKKLAVEDQVFQVKSQLKSINTQQLLEQVIDLPENMPPIALLLDADLKPEVLKNQVTEENLSLSGELVGTIIYLDEGGGVQHCAAPQGIPFKLSLPNDTGQKEIVVEPVIKVNAKPELNPASDGITLYGDLDFKLNLFTTRYVRLVMNLECSGCIIETRTRTVMLDNLVGEKVQQSSVQGIVELGDDYPPIREVLGAKGQIKSFDYRIDEDKVIVEGAINLQIVYLAHTEEETKPLYMAEFNNAIPFQQSIAIGGVQPGMTATLKMGVDEIELDLINRETIEVDVKYQGKVAVNQPVHQEVVAEAIEIQPEVEKPPSITYVFVKTKDTLWKLSRQYHTTVEAIIDSNSWLRERDIMEIKVGDRLCIPRGM